MEIDLPQHPGDGKHSPRAQLALYLIRAELKNTKLTRDLERLGFDPTNWTLDFAAVILNLAGHQDRSDAVYDWYHKLLEQYSSRITDPQDAETLTSVAHDFYAVIEEKAEG